MFSFFIPLDCCTDSCITYPFLVKAMTVCNHFCYFGFVNENKDIFFQMTIHSRDMKTQHIKFEILQERLRLFYCNFIQHNFVPNMFSTGQICKENFHPFGGVMDDVTKSLDACHR